MRRTKSAQGLHDWIGLLDVSGPFLSLSNLHKAFPMGLESLTPGLRQQFQLAFEEWYESRDPRIHRAWIEWVLKAVLEYDDEVLLTCIPTAVCHQDEATREVVVPNFLVVSADEDPKSLLPVLVVPKGQKLGQPLAGAAWVASPNQRLQSLLRSSKLTHGLVTNGAEWALIHIREGDATGTITFRADIVGDEEDLLRAFVSCLGIRRVVGAAEGESLAELLLASRDDEEQLTLDLGKQVRQSVELLVREMDRLDESSGRELLKGQANEHLYRGCLTVLMRLMFLLCAEERKLLPVDTSEAYSDCYAATTLLSQLEVEASQHGEEILERRYDAWIRLLATARLMYGGSPLPELQMTAYGGSLFDPAQYPFLERLKVNNRVTLHMLESLQYILVDGVSGKERRRVSFEALDVEQIGYVYEGLLDHTIETAAEPVLGLIGKVTYEPELPISMLDEISAKGEKGLLKFLRAESVCSTEKAIEKLLDAQISPERNSGLRAACGGDEAVFREVVPWANIVRTDTIGRHQVYLAGSRYVTSSNERRGTGTHYTPRFLAEEMVEHTLEPLIVEGMAEGWPQERWRKKTTKELLNLRIADIAMGSGAFLVAVCRYLSTKVVEAWNDAESATGERLVCTEAGEMQLAFDPERPDRLAHQDHETAIGTMMVADPKRNEPLPLDGAERVALARSMVVDRCLYGVDINPMAVEMAKLSLWLITMRKDRPFHFLDHALKCGDSLVGVTLEELTAFSLDPKKELLGGSVLMPWLPDAIARIRNLRGQILKTPSNTEVGVRARAVLHKRAERDETALRMVADLLLADILPTVSTSTKEERLALLGERPDPEAARWFGEILGRATFHFELEFADVFASGGFDAIIGNPPFVGGKRISTSMGAVYREYIVRRVAGRQSGSADLCAYFFLRAMSLLLDGGCLGFLATNTISEGDTREVGLDLLLKSSDHEVLPRACAYRAVKSVEWPSKSASLEVAKVWLRKGTFDGVRVLEGVPTGTISSMLDSEDGDRKPKELAETCGLSHIGAIVLGMGLVLDSVEAKELTLGDKSLGTVVLEYLNGEDLNSRPDQSPSRWVINFRDWPLGRLGQRLPISGEEVVAVARTANPQKGNDWFPTSGSRWYNADDERQKHWLQMGVVPPDYPHPVALDHPTALRIAEARVRPERSRLKRDAYRIRWWQFGEKQLSMFAAIRSLRRCLARSRVSQYHNFAWIRTDIVMSEQVVIIATDRDAMFAAVQSMWHQVWTEKNASSMRTDTRYTPSDCFETFPLPKLTEAMDASGNALDEARRAAMQARNIGLTDVARLMHNPNCQAPDIIGLREAVIANDLSVTESYRWSVDLGHDHHPTPRGPRFTVSPEARIKMLRLLLAENHRRYAEEEAAAKVGPDFGKVRRSRRHGQETDVGLFGSGDLEEADL